MMSRRSMMLGGLAGAMGAVGLSSAQAYAARYVYPYEPVLERVTIPVPRQHAWLDGLKIGFVTDTHVGPFISDADVVRALDLLRPEAPDLLLLGGDYASESPRYVAGVAEVLGAFARGTPLGGFGVMGNHDYSISGKYTFDDMENAGIGMLANDVVEIRVGRESLWIAGIDETLLGKPDPVGTIGKAPEGAAVLALWHEPQFAERAADAGAFAQLSGHTHGGQIRLPGIGPVGLPVHGKRHVIGTSEANGMPVYTSRGVGVYRPPMRFNCPPEVTLITLRAASDGE